MMNWKQIGTIILAIVGSGGIVTGILTIDDRYTKRADLEAVKDQIIGEMRSEVSKNRDIMIQNLEREQLDLEFEIETIQDSSVPVPHYLRAKVREIENTLKELQSEDTE